MEMTPKLKQAVKEYKSGKAESFDTLYKESEKYIYTCIYKVMSGNNNAVDITNEIMQNTYLQIFLNISQLEDEDRFLSWAGTIATRECFAYIKKNKKYVLLNEDDDTFENLSDSDDIIPEEVMQNLEKRKLVRKIIDTQLTDVQKICIYEYYYNNRKQTEIAELYEMPLNTVKTNLARAKAKVEEGVLDLEKKNGIRLHSFAPFFVLLFTEDVMAAEVPAEIGTSVLSSVADVSAKAMGASTSAGGATSTSAMGSASATSTVASKVGVLGKIAAASTKAKILMAVATVSVVGTVGGGVIVASQNGLFIDAPAVNENQVEDENQEIGENQETDENLLTTEKEEIQSTEEQIEETITEEMDASYIEYTYYSSYRDETVHFKVAYVPDEVWNGENRDNAEALVRRSLIQYDEETYEKFYFRLFPLGDIKNSGLDLKNMSDEKIGAYTGGTADYSTLEKVETEDAYMVFVEYDIEMDLEPFKGYDLYINDYRTGKAYELKLNRTAAYYDSELALKILKSFEILTEESDENETAIETVNLEDGGTKGIETPYGNGLSDYEIWHTNSSNGASIHYIVRNVMSNAKLYNADNGTQAQLDLLNESTNYEGYKLYVCPQGSIENSRINLKNMSDDEVGKFANSTYEIVYRTETDVMSTALVKYNKEWWICYDYYVNDYTTGQSWWYMIHATESFASQEIIEDIINRIEIVEISE